MKTIAAALILLSLVCSGCEQNMPVVATKSTGADDVKPEMARPVASTMAAAVFSASAVQYDHGFETYVLTSDYQEKPCKVWVLLPDKFDRGAKYKVLYMLPALGAGDYYGLREAKKQDLANKYNIICVNPDFSRMPWYGDNPENPKIRYDSYFTDVVVPFIDKTYPTIASPAGRMTIGFSKGGIGSVSLLLRHPDVFGRAGAWDAPLMQNDNHPDYYGSDANFKKNFYIPDLLTKDASVLSQQPARIAVTGVGFSLGTAPFQKELEQLNIPSFCDASWHGDHAWESGWVEPLVSVLMSDDMTKAKPIVHMILPRPPKTRPSTKPS